MEINEDAFLIVGGIIQPEDPLMRLDVLSAINSFSRDVSNLKWFLDNLHGIQHEYTRGVFLGYISDHVHTSWTNIDPSIHEQLVQEFFTSIFEDENFMKPQFLYKIYQIQADMVFQFYPETMPTLFQEIVSKPKPHLYGFLDHLAISLHSNSSIIFRDIDGLKQHMLEDGSQMLLLETVFNDVEQGIEGSIQAVSSLVEWVDITILNSIEIVQRLFALVQQPATIDGGILCLLNFLKRPNSPDTLAEFISETEIAPTLEQVIAAGVTEKAALNICELIIVLVQPLIHTEVADLFLESAKALLEFDSTNVTSKIVPFLKEYVQNHTENSEAIANMALEKILAVIETHGADQDLALQSPLMLLKATALVASSLTEQMMTLSSELDPSENMDGCAAILAALVKAITDNDPQMEIVQMFREILEIEPEENNSYFIAISCYAKLASPFVKDPSNSEFAIELFKVGANAALAFADEISTVYHDYLQDTLMKIASSNPSGVFEIEGIADVICAFISSGQEKLLKIAITLSSQMSAEDRSELYSSCLSGFGEQLGSEDGVSNKTIRNVFDFIYGMNLEDCDAIKPMVGSFLAAAKTFPESNHSYLPIFVKAAVKTLGAESFELFWDSIGVLDWTVIGDVAEAAIGLEDNDVLLQIGEMLITKLHTVPLKVQSNTPVSDDELSYSDFHIKCALFFIRSGVYPLLNEEMQMSVIGEFSDIISNIVATYEVIGEILDFQDQVLTEKSIPIMMVNSAILAAILNSKEKEYDEKDRAATLLYKYLNFSRHQICICKDAYTKLVDDAYKGTGISPSLIVEYSEIASIEDDDLFKARSDAFVKDALKSYTIGAPQPPALSIPAPAESPEDDSEFLA